MRRSRGLSLIETIVCFAILTFIMGAILIAFTHSSRSFRHALLRQGLQGDAIKLETLLGRDVRMTNFYSNIVVNRPFTTSGGRLVNRDGLSVAAMDDWDNPANYDPVTSLPLWNQYIVYYATNDGDFGKLYRQLIDPGAPTGGLPYPTLSANMRNDPSLNLDVITTNLISSQVDDLSIRPDDNTQGMEVVLRLRRRGERRRAGGEEKVDETLEAQFSPIARNTIPKF